MLDTYTESEINTFKKVLSKIYNWPLDLISEQDIEDEILKGTLILENKKVLFYDELTKKILVKENLKN